MEDMKVVCICFVN